MSRRCRNYCDDSDSDVDLPRSGRASRSAASRKGSGEFGMKSRKEQSRPWSQEESEWLIQVVSKTSTNLDNINWQDVAKQVPGRTGKQCREKWKNDLRPNICKEPWSLKEEYVLAVAHSLHGNRWSEVAKYLPTRPENTIKNRWYATNRAKAEVKIRTFLWLYSDLVDRQSYPAGPEAIDKARELYRQLPDVVPLEEFEVPVDFYIAKNADGCPAALDTRPEIKIIGRGKAKPHVPGATTVGGGGGGGGSAAAAAAAVLSAVRGGTAGGGTRTARAGGGGGAAAASASIAASAAVAAATAAAASAAGSGGKGRGGADSGGGGHSEGDANCYVKVGGLAGELPAVGPIKTTPRKRKISGLTEADGTSHVGVPLHKLVKAEHTAAEALGVVAAAAAGDAAATVSTLARGAAPEDPRASPLGGSHLTAAQGALMAASPSASATAAATAVTTVTTGVGRSGSAGGAPHGCHGHHQHHQHHQHPGVSPLDPELLWQTAIEPFSHHPHNNGGGCGNNPTNNPGLSAQKGRRTSASRLGGAPARVGGAAHPAAGASMYGAPCGGATTVPQAGGDSNALFPPNARLGCSEGGASSAADLGLFQLGRHSLGGLLEDPDGAVGGGSVGGHDADPDLLSLTDGLDLASLTALIGPNEMHGDAGSDCAHEAMAGLAADVLCSQMPEPPTPHMVHQHPHHQQHHQQHPQQHPHHQQHPQQQLPPQQQQQQQQQHAHSHISQTVTTPQQHQHQGAGQQQQQQQQQDPHHMYALHPVMRHATSMGSAQQPSPPQQRQQHPHHPHSMSQGSYPLHPQPLQQQQQQQQMMMMMQQHEGGACSPAQQQAMAARGSAPMHLSQQQQQQPQGSSDGTNPQLQQQQQSMPSSHDVTSGASYMSYQRRMAPGGTMPPGASRPPPQAAAAVPAAATPPPGHHPLPPHPMYGSPSYMPHPHSHPGSAPPATPGAPPMMANGGSRGMMASAPSPSPVKYGMASPYGVSGPPPPGAPYGVTGPPPPYMMSMNVRGGYYKVPGNRMPGVMPRSMMPYAPPPYGMSVYPSHGMPPGYMDAQQQQQQQQQQQAGGMGPGACDGGPYHPQQGGTLEPCTPGAGMNSSGTGPGRSGGLSQGGGGGGGLDSLPGMGPMGMGRAYGDMPSSVGAPGGGPGM